MVTQSSIISVIVIKQTNNEWPERDHFHFSLQDEVETTDFGAIWARGVLPGTATNVSFYLLSLGPRSGVPF